jgi:hypothetical protein
MRFMNVIRTNEKQYSVCGVYPDINGWRPDSMFPGILIFLADYVWYHEFERPVSLLIPKRDQDFFGAMVLTSTHWAEGEPIALKFDQIVALIWQVSETQSILRAIFQLVKESAKVCGLP